MYVASVGTDVIPSTSQPGRPTATVGRSATSFMDLMKHALAATNETHLQADSAVRALATGRTDSVHDVVLSVAKADMSFRILLELRNRIMDAYQEVMRLQI